MEFMTITTWLKRAQAQLEAMGIATARLDTLVLLEDELHTDRTHLLAHPEIKLTSQNIKVLGTQIARRANHEPLAYVRGRTEFYGREFIVSPAVLEPRPESETMIKLLKQADLPASPHIADVGTGSGALGITAQLELPNAQVDLVEIDPKALQIAKQNVIKYTTGVQLIKSDLLSAATRQYDVLLCNLPYVPDDHTINQAAMHEPKIAIFGGPDGLDIYRHLFEQIKNLEAKPLLILTESLPPQHNGLAVIARSAGYNQQKEDDFIQVFAPAKI